MIELRCQEDLGKYGETRLIKCLHENPKWKYDRKSTMFVYDGSTIFAFNELGGSHLEGHCLLMRLVFTLPSCRGKGKSLEGLKSLVECCEIAKCAMLASVSPFKMRRAIYDIDLALNRMKLNQFDVLEAEHAEMEISGMKRLLTRAGFENNIDLHGVLNFLDSEFPIDRTFIYTPTTIDPTIARYIQFLMPDKFGELFEDWEE